MNPNFIARYSKSLLIINMVIIDSNLYLESLMMTKSCKNIRELAQKEGCTNKIVISSKGIVLEYTWDI